MGKIGDISAVEPLIKALNYWHVDQCAAYALGDIGDIRCVEPLIAVLQRYSKDKDREYVRIAAVWSLGKIANSKAIECLIDAIGNDSVEVSKQAKKALEYIGFKAVSPLIQALTNISEHVRRVAILLLLKIGDSSAIDRIVPLLGDESRHVRDAAIMALDKFGYINALEPLIQALKSSQKYLKFSV